jgi:cobalt-zinc-cadmium efflux system membrane fusion protein
MNKRAKFVAVGLLGAVAFVLALAWITPRGNFQTAGLAQAAGKPESQKEASKEKTGGKEKQPKAKHDDGKEGESDHEGVVKLSPEEMKEHGIKVQAAGPGEIKVTLRLSGEVQFDPDLVVRVRTQAPGVVREARKKVGDTVRQGEVLAVLESRELAEANAKLASSRAKETLVKAAFQREEQLWKEKITSEREYLEARQAMQEAVIERQLAQRRLATFGSVAAGGQEATDQGMARYELKAPMSGTIIERNLVRGEFLKEEAERPPLVIADTGRVWVNLAVNQKDLARVVPGNKALVIFDHGIAPAEGVVDYVSPAVGEGTRTATARVILSNPGNRYRPGLFVSAEVVVDKERAEVLVPKAAVQTLEGKQVVWVEDAEGFRPTPVEVGRSNGESVEVTSGLEPGQRYVTEGVFTLKAELGKEAFGEGHGH